MHLVTLTQNNGLGQVFFGLGPEGNFLFSFIGLQANYEGGSICALQHRFDGTISAKPEGGAVVAPPILTR